MEDMQWYTKFSPPTQINLSVAPACVQQPGSEQNLHTLTGRDTAFTRRSTAKRIVSLKDPPSDNPNTLTQDTVDTIYARPKPPVLRSCQDRGDKDVKVSSIPIYFPEDLVGRTFLMDKQEDGQWRRASVIEVLKTHDTPTKDEDAFKKFRCSINNDEYEDILTYN